MSSIADILLPPNCENFGGCDVTKTQGTDNKPGLFKFHDLKDDDYDVQNVFFDPKVGGNGALNLKVPKFLQIETTSTFDKFVITGETRTRYQSSLSQKFGMSGGAFGFSAEIDDSFSENTDIETYAKYVGSYQIGRVYQLELKSTDAEDLRKWLSDDAISVFSKPASHIVSEFGTHFMKRATFGGAPQKVDIRDESIEEDLATAMDVKVSIEDPEFGNPQGGASVSNASSTVQKLHNFMSTSVINLLGGTLGSPDAKTWLQSLATSPSIAEHDLITLDQLIIDQFDGQGKQQAVKDEIARVLAAQQMKQAKALVMYVQLTGGEDDGGSGAHDDIKVNFVQAPDGWFTLGHYAQMSHPQDAWRNNPGSWQGIAIKEAPGVAAGSVIRKPTGQFRVWGVRSPHRMGLYEMTGDAGFSSLSAFFFRDEGIDLGRLGTSALIADDILVPANYATRLWSDAGSGAQDNGSAWGITGPQDANMLKSSTNVLAAFCFHTNNDENNSPSISPKQLDFNQVRVVSNKFLTDL